MKKLKKLKLHSAVELQEKEMKAVQGGRNVPCSDLTVLCTPAMCMTSDSKWGHCKLDTMSGICFCQEHEQYEQPEPPGVGYDWPCCDYPFPFPYGCGCND